MYKQSSAGITELKDFVRKATEMPLSKEDCVELHRRKANALLRKLCRRQSEGFVSECTATPRCRSRHHKKLVFALAFSVVLVSYGNVYLYECEKFEEKGGWSECAKCEKRAGSKVLCADKVGAGAETTITTPGAGGCHSWIRTANLFETNQPPSKFIYQINGDEKEIVVNGEKDKFVWVDGGPVMLPGGYSSIGITLSNGSKAAVDCVVVTNESDFKPPTDAAGLKKLREENTRE